MSKQQRKGRPALRPNPLGAAPRHTDRRPASAESHFVAGSRHHLDGDVIRAGAEYEAALAIEPAHWEARHLLGVVRAQCHHHDDAVGLIEQAITDAGDADPADAAATRTRVNMRNNLALSLIEVGRLEDAYRALTAAVEQDPEHPEVRHNLARTFQKANRADEAMIEIRRAIALRPDFPMSHAVLGELLMDQGRLRSAIASLRRCLDLGGTLPDVYARLGMTYRWLVVVDDALDALHTAAGLAPEWPGAHTNLGITLCESGHFEEGMAEHDLAITLAPDDASLRLNRAFALLSLGDLEQGWREFEWGMESGQRGKRRHIDRPEWDGRDLRDARIMTYREQGVGDEIMFASCYPDLIERADQVVIECEPRLRSLFARSFPDALVRDQTVAPDGTEALADDFDFDVVVPAGSLPRAFRPSLASFPSRRAYLRPDPAAVAQWRARFASLGDGPRVAFSWRSRLMTHERALEYTRLDQWAELFAIPGVVWINVQYDDCERELLDAEARFGVRIERCEGVDLMNDFDAVAAICAASDLVISPQNALGHLAAAVGAPTLMMGNRFWWNNLGALMDPASRWYPWLPAARLITRVPGESWDAVLAEVRDCVSAAATLGVQAA